MKSPEVLSAASPDHVRKDTMKDTMKTRNGLTVPVGYGGNGSVVLKGALRPQKRASRGTSKGRTFPAGQVAEGTKLRGQRTFDTYEVLKVEDDGQDCVTLHVLNTRTNEIRRWLRRKSFRVELA